MKLFAGVCFLIPLACGQILLDGEWEPQFHEDQVERIPGPELGDYAGLPINDAARQRAQAWDASRLTLQEHQCRVHVGPYIYRGPLDLRIWQEKDPETQSVIAIKNYISTYMQTRTIWMDGRPHPPAWAAHTWMGFSTGTWEGGVLTVETTHLKQGWLRRNGLPMSDQATMREHFIRHGDHLTHMVLLRDPVYLAEAMVKTEDFTLNLTGAKEPWTYPCRPVLEITTRAKGEVPHHLPGENPQLKEFPTRHNIPEASANGGPATMYPEFRPSQPARNPVGKTRAVPIPAEPAEVQAVKLQGNVWLLVGAGGNVLVQAGSQGALLVDTGRARSKEKLLAAVRGISSEPVRWVINTSGDADHVGGNEAVAAIAGSTRHIELVNTPFASAASSAEFIAAGAVEDRMSKPEGAQAAYPVEAWPTETYVNDKNELFFNGEAIEMHHPGSAHTDGDTMVFLRRSDVIATGELFDPDRYPLINLQRGGSLQGIINGLNKVLELAIPTRAEEGGTVIIPGHGRICDEADLVEYRDMLTIVRDRLASMIRKGMTLAQVLAARPTMDYDPLYGVNTDVFVEAAYRSMTRK